MKVDGLGITYFIESLGSWQFLNQPWNSLHRIEPKGSLLFSTTAHVHIPVLIHFNSVHTLLSISWRCFNIILPSMPRCSKLSLSLRFSTKSCMHAHLLSRICAMYRTYIIFLDLFTQIIVGEDHYHKHTQHIPLGSAYRLPGTSHICTYE